jgi:hypothetical protein
MAISSRIADEEADRRELSILAHRIPVAFHVSAHPESDLSQILRSMVGGSTELEKLVDKMLMFAQVRKLTLELWSAWFGGHGQVEHWSL